MWNRANIKGASKGARIYVGRSTTEHNLLFSIHTLCMDYVTKTFLLVSSSVRSKQLLCLIGQFKFQKRQLYARRLMTIKIVYQGVMRLAHIFVSGSLTIRCIILFSFGKLADQRKVRCSREMIFIQSQLWELVLHRVKYQRCFLPRKKKKKSNIFPYSSYHGFITWPWSSLIMASTTLKKQLRSQPESYCLKFNIQA